MAYGGHEIAVLKFFGNDKDDWELCYDTPLTSNVLGHLRPSEIDGILKQIKELEE